MPKKCPHNRFKPYCKECGGSTFCPHGKRKSHCKECGGSQICEHRKIKSRCKECKADKDESIPLDIEEYSLIEFEASKILSNL